MLRLAVVRYLFLPLYAKWWVAQTSSRIFAFLLFLYVMQMLNWAIFSYNVNKPQTKSNESDTCSANGEENRRSSANDFVSISDLVVPMTLSLLLSLIHSQILATSSASLSPGDKLNKNPIQPNRKRRERKKRRKSTRSRSSMATDSKTRTNSLVDETEPVETNVQVNRRLSQPTNEASDSNCSPPRLRKRNVNWRSPIKSNHSANVPNPPESPEVVEPIDNAIGNLHEVTGADDDGFESLNGKSSSGEEMSALNNGQAHEVTVDNESAARRSQQQYVNSAYLKGTFENHQVNSNSDNDLINNVNNGISEKVSPRTQQAAKTSHVDDKIVCVFSEL